MLVVTISSFTGYGLGFYRATVNTFPEIETVGEINPGISTIKLFQVENGHLSGEVVGAKARIAYSAEGILEKSPGESFEIPLNQVNLGEYYVLNQLPEGARYIASEKGQYYYSILDKRAFNITEENRIYFSSEEEAELNGYKSR